MVALKVVAVKAVEVAAVVAGAGAGVVSSGR